MRTVSPPWKRIWGIAADAVASLCMMSIATAYVGVVIGGDDKFGNAVVGGRLALGGVAGTAIFIAIAVWLNRIRDRPPAIIAAWLSRGGERDQPTSLKDTAMRSTVIRIAIVAAVLQPVQVASDAIWKGRVVKVTIEFIQDYEEPLPACWWIRSCGE